jgi:hypothetical protein
MSPSLDKPEPSAFCFESQQDALDRAGTGPDDYCYLNAGLKLQTASAASEYLLRPLFKLIIEAA